MSVALADELQIWGFEGDSIIYGDGSIGAAFHLSGRDPTFWSNDDLGGFSDRLNQFLNSLPSGIDLQFQQRIQPTSILEAKVPGSSAVTGSTLEELTRKRQAVLSEQNSCGRLPEHELLLIIRTARKTRLRRKSKPFWMSGEKSADTGNFIVQEIKRLEKITEDISASLESLGVMTRQLTATEISTRVYRQWNPDRKIELGNFDPEDVRTSLLFTDLLVHEKGVKLGTIDHRVLSLKLLPDQTISCMAEALGDLPFNSTLCLSISVPEQLKEIESLQTQRRLAFSLANARPDRTRDIESEAKFSDLESTIEEMVQGGEKIFHVGLNVILMSDDQNELDSQISQTLAKVRELSGAEAMVETVAASEIFRDLSFPNGRCRERQKRMKTSNLSDFLPIYAPWPGHGSGVALFRTRTESLLRFDPFSQDLSNANQLISGASGSGKSFLCNKLLLQWLTEDPRLFIVDIGGSYKKLCESLDGQYIPLGIGQNLSINPFDLPDGESFPSEQKLKFLLGLIETMTKEDGEAGLGRLERAELESKITDLYRNVSNPRLSDLAADLRRHEDPAMKSIGKILVQWTGESPFGKFVDCPTNIKLGKSLICFDLKGLEAQPDLQAVCLFIITDLIWRKVQAEPQRKKYLVLDECWKILSTTAGANLVGEVFRTFRKYYASAIAISQTMDDFSRSKVADAIIPNSSVKWLLKQRGSNKENLQRLLLLNENELSVVDSLQSRRGSYSEAFLVAGDNRSVVRVEPTPLEYWISTTDPRDLGAIEQRRLLELESTVIERLKYLAGEFPNGIAAHS